ncbi:hypothetical protein [Scopulibacillus cellulosilyticus]|uniref:Uncharacterized protein n=1 Tax=Scopulibacillus cellulosilyticus TaxID=2665665 RepID=A0ABW2Q0N2_9BACL
MTYKHLDVIIYFLMFFFYLLSKKWVPVQEVNFKQQVKSVWWLLAFYLGLMIVSFLGSFGGIGLLKYPFDLVSVAFVALLTFIWSQYSALPEASIDYDEVEDEVKNKSTVTIMDTKAGSQK